MLVGSITFCANTYCSLFIVAILRLKIMQWIYYICFRFFMFFTKYGESKAWHVQFKNLWKIIIIFLRVQSGQAKVVLSIGTTYFIIWGYQMFESVRVPPLRSHNSKIAFQQISGCYSKHLGSSFDVNFYWPSGGCIMACK